MLAGLAGCGKSAPDADSNTVADVADTDSQSTDDGQFKTDDFTINTPDGYAWRFLRNVDHGGAKGSVYVCSTTSSPTAMSLTIEETKRSNDGNRKAGVVGHFNGTIESLASTGAKPKRVEKPVLVAPIGDRVSFVVECLEPTGASVFCFGQTVFGKNTYLFQAFSQSESEARKLISFADTFTEK
jgi:hypothetical protein